MKIGFAQKEGTSYLHILNAVLRAKYFGKIGTKEVLFFLKYFSPSGQTQQAASAQVWQANHGSGPSSRSESCHSAPTEHQSLDCSAGARREEVLC